MCLNALHVIEQMVEYNMPWFSDPKSPKIMGFKSMAISLIQYLSEAGI